MARNKNEIKINKKCSVDNATKVFFLDKSIVQESIRVHKIQLPRKISYFIRNDNGMYEMMKFNEKNRCFFINDTLNQNGSIYLAVKIDPLFMFIQFLEKECKMIAQPVDQIFPNSAEVFLDFISLDQMRLVADQKGPDSLQAFIFNEEKALKWLKIKFNRIKDSLKQQKIISAGSSSLNFVSSSIHENEMENDNEIDSTALGIISEYISLDLFERLDVIYGISEKAKEPISQKRKSNTNEKEPNSKKIKTEEKEDLLEIAKENVKTTPVLKIPTKNAAKLEKAAKGMKSISSFFTRK